MDIISSSKNEKIKELVKLQTAKGRKKAGMYLLEGEHLVEEAIKERAQIKLIVVTGNRLEDYENLLAQTDVQVLVVSQDVFHKLSMTETTQGILAVVEIVKQEILPHKGHLIVLDAVQDPGNLGTIVRTADAAGFDAVILGTGSVDLYNDKVLRSMQGSHFHIPVFQANLQEYLPILKEKGVQVAVTALHRDSKDYTILQGTIDVAIVVGNEGQGVSDDVIDLADVVVTIPMFGKAESLNVAIASALLMYKTKETKE
ncbi:RNA methyltransferase [Granulicatella adiacens]|uniref:TrmH family RNA methyltransferase n=1 Tax=Granulicatella adiacens TaxID=46124 RepID=UPI00352D0FA0